MKWLKSHENQRGTHHWEGLYSKLQILNVVDASTHGPWVLVSGLGLDLKFGTAQYLGQAWIKRQEDHSPNFSPARTSDIAEKELGFLSILGFYSFLYNCIWVYYYFIFEFKISLSLLIVSISWAWAWLTKWASSGLTYLKPHENGSGT